jgi:hypothetical protein
MVVMEVLIACEKNPGMGGINRVSLSEWTEKPVCAVLHLQYRLQILAAWVLHHTGAEAFKGKQLHQ